MPASATGLHFGVGGAASACDERVLRRSGFFVVAIIFGPQSNFRQVRGSPTFQHDIVLKQWTVACQSQHGQPPSSLPLG